MLTLRPHLHLHKGTHHWGMAATAVVLTALVGLAVVGSRTHFQLGQATPEAPVYVNQTSSLIGSSDGTLLEGGDAAPAPAPAVPAPLLLAGAAGGLGLSAAGLWGAYRRFARTA